MTTTKILPSLRTEPRVSDPALQTLNRSAAEGLGRKGEPPIGATSLLVDLKRHARARMLGLIARAGYSVLTLEAHRS